MLKEHFFLSSISWTKWRRRRRKRTTQKLREIVGGPSSGKKKTKIGHRCGREKTLTCTTNTHSICHEKFSSSNLFPWVSVERPLHVEMSSSLSLKEEITLPNARTLQYVMMPQTTCSKTMMPLLPSSSLTQMSGEEGASERVTTKYFWGFFLLFPSLKVNPTLFVVTGTLMNGTSFPFFMMRG